MLPGIFIVLQSKNKINKITYNAPGVLIMISGEFNPGKISTIERALNDGDMGKQRYSLRTLNEGCGTPPFKFQNVFFMLPGILIVLQSSFIK